MKIKLIRNVKDTKMLEAGSIVDLDNDKAKGLIAIGVAELVEEPKKEIKSFKLSNKETKEEE